MEKGRQVQSSAKTLLLIESWVVNVPAVLVPRVGFILISHLEFQPTITIIQTYIYCILESSETVKHTFSMPPKHGETLQIVDRGSNPVPSSGGGGEDPNQGRKPDEKKEPAGK
jgi:hypothetical protein